MAQETHTLMPKKLAQALIDSGMHHFSLGGMLGAEDGYQASAPGIAKQENLTGQIGYLQNQQQDVYKQQQSLGNQLLAQTQGQGPNVAQDQLNQATGANVANQAALMANQRGASANPGEIARQAAMQGGNIQQQAVGQAATLGAQQQLGAQSNLAGLQNNLANQNLQGQSINQGALASQNSAVTTGQLGAQGINANAAATNAQTNGGIIGGLLGGAGAALGAIFHDGGIVKKMADGGPVNDNIGIANFSTPGAYNYQGPSASGGASLGQGLLNAGSAFAKNYSPSTSSAPSAEDSTAAWMSSPAGQDGALGNAPWLNKGGAMPFSMALLQGGKVPGQAQVSGNSIKNDTQPAMLSPGEVVLPRSVTQSGDPVSKAAEFMKHLMDKKESEGGPGYKKVAQAKQKAKK